MADQRLKEQVPKTVQKVMQTLKAHAEKLPPALQKVREQMGEVAGDIERATKPYSEFQKLKNSFDQIEQALTGKAIKQSQVAEQITASISSLKSLPLAQPLSQALERILAISHSGDPAHALKQYLPNRTAEWVSQMIDAAKSGRTAPLKEAIGAGQAAVEVVSAHLSEWKEKLSALSKEAGSMLSKSGLSGVAGFFKNLFKKQG